VRRQGFALENQAHGVDPRFPTIRCEAAEDDDVENEHVGQQRARGADGVGVVVDRAACDRAWYALPRRRPEDER